MKVTEGQKDARTCCQAAIVATSVENPASKSTVSVHHLFCPTCGTQIRPVKQCCQQSVGMGYNFCNACGAEIRKFRTVEA
jgi:hypothetical protein